MAVALYKENVLTAAPCTNELQGVRNSMADSSNVWSDERLAELEKLWSEGLSISQIGEALGVSRNSIAGKAHRMGLPKRPSPINAQRVVKSKPVEVAPPSRDLPLRMELRQLEWSRSKCCWPTGDPRKRIFVLRDAIVPGKPYCLKHCGQAYTTSRDLLTAKKISAGLYATSIFGERRVA